MIRIELPRTRGKDVTHGYSAFVECLLNLHVAFDRNDHPLAESRLRLLRRLDGGLRRRLESFRPLFEADPPDVFLAWPLDGNETFEAGLARVSALPSELLLEQIGNAAGADPAAFTQELCATLAEYWEATFAGDWVPIERRLAESVDEAARLLAERGLSEMLGKLSPSIRADDRVLAIESAEDADVVASPERPVRFSPTLFVWRRVLVAADERWPTTVLYTAPASARFLRPDHAPQELVDMLSALADDTRLRVLKLVATRPRTAQELAPIVGMSTTGLSKILRKLADAGLLEGKREGYYVVYSLNTARIRTLPLVLEEFLRSRDTRAA